MLLGCFLLLFLHESTVKSQSTIYALGYTSHSDHMSYVLDLATAKVMTSTTTEEIPSPLQLVAKPDYPVAFGQRVDLHCNALSTDFVSWSHLENETWKEVGRGSDLVVTLPEESGLYRCHAKSRSSQERVSHNHSVYIVSVSAKVSDNLGIAAFVLSLLALVINIAILFWMYWHRPGSRLSPFNTAAKGFPGSEMSPKGGSTETDGQVYMNYSSTNETYSDLDPTSMCVNSVYSSLP